MLSLIIPTINEGNNLRKVLPLVKNLCDEIIVVDDASTDDTIQVSEEFGCKVLSRPTRLGCGKAVYDGVIAARNDIVAIMDADLSHPPALLKCKYLVEDNLVDIIKFSRFASGGGMENKRRLIAFRIFNLMMSFILGVRTKEITSGFIISRKDCFTYPKRANTEWSLEFMRHNRKKRIAEIPFFYAERREGKSKNTDLHRILLYLLSAIRLRFKIK